MELLKYVIIALLGGLAVSASVDRKHRRRSNELTKNGNTEVARVPKPMRVDHPDYYHVKADQQLSCELYETQCGDGCCPFSDGVCCSDGYECCRQGQVCIPYIGICLGIQSQSNGNLTLDSQKTTAVKTTKSCPSGTTTCPTGCCPFPDAVCCPDGEHCCPNGFTCTASGCAANGTTNAFLREKIGLPAQNAQVNVLVLYNSNPMLPSVYNTAVKTIKSCPPGTTTCLTGCCPFPDAVCCPDGQHCCPNGFTCTATGCAANGTTNSFIRGRIDQPAQNAQVNVPVPYNSNPMMPSVYPSSIMSLKTCPDGKRQCPQGSSCCISDNGGWNCCPSPPVSVTAVGRLQDDNCCNTYLGWTCCLFWKCHYWGCWWW